MSNSQNNNVDKAPFLGDLPILGALFRSNGFKRSQTELMIVITPYLVKPVSPNQIVLPTDGLRAPTDAQRIIGGQTFEGRSGERREGPRTAPPQTVPAPATGPKTGQPASIPDAGFSAN
jgi:pilus assembly protein CpaC